MKLDDPVGAITVHGICGIWGTLAVGLFDTANGLFYGGGVQLLGIQALGIIAVMVWTIGTVGYSYLFSRVFLLFEYQAKKKLLV